MLELIELDFEEYSLPEPALKILVLNALSGESYMYRSTRMQEVWV